jgi:hypothetical protein
MMCRLIKILFGKLTPIRTEDVVSEKTAIFAKEMGYNEITYRFYYRNYVFENGYYHRNSKFKVKGKINKNDCVVAPTYSELHKWLRKQGIYCVITPYFKYDAIYYFGKILNTKRPKRIIRIPKTMDYEIMYDKLLYKSLEVLKRNNEKK